MISICPGCKARVKAHRRQYHSAVCTKPSRDEQAMVAFAGPVSECARCKRFISHAWFSGHLQACPAKSNCSTLRPRKASEHKTCATPQPLSVNPDACPSCGRNVAPLARRSHLKVCTIYDEGSARKWLGSEVTKCPDCSKVVSIDDLQAHHAICQPALDLAKRREESA